MKLIVTIDTEEDEWGNFNSIKPSLENISEIPEVQEIFDSYDVKPTYLVNYPVANNDNAVRILSEILASDRCEIGAHCHPWNTPPFLEVTNPKNSMLYNLPVELQLEKIKVLTKLIQTRFMKRPTSFRSGRWGYSQEVANCLLSLGYLVDSSITPYINWQSFDGPDYSMEDGEPFFYSNIKHGMNKTLLEIPVTVGFSRSNFKRSSSFYKFVRRENLKKFHLVGLLDRMGLLQRIVLSPELHNAKQMKLLTRMLYKRGSEFIHMYFHSPTLRVGATSYVKNSVDKVKFLDTLNEYLFFTKKMGYESITLSEARNSLNVDNFKVLNSISFK